MKLINSIVRHGGTWLFHWGMAISNTLISIPITGDPIHGAIFAAGGYTYRELDGIMSEYNVNFEWIWARLKAVFGGKKPERDSRRPSLDQWIDHFGDLLGAYLTLLVTWIITT